MTIIFFIKKRLTKIERQAINMPEYQGQALIGLLLGDGWLSMRSLASNARFGFAQSGKVEKLDYFWHIFNLFSFFCTPGLTPTIKTFARVGYDTVLTSISFVTMQLPCFNVYYQMFYVNGKRIVPYNIGELLTNVGLAYWIMDDGSIQNNGLHLNVYGFDPESVNRLILVLQQNFGLTCSIHKHKSHNMSSRIYIHAHSIDNVRCLVKSHIVPSMMYKLGL